MTTPKVDMARIDIEQLERTESALHEKPLSTAYIADTDPNSHHKSAVERRLVLKCDLVIVPLAALIYFGAYLVSYEPTILSSNSANQPQDRNSIGNAKIMGLLKDLHISAQGYYNCATMFCMRILGHRRLYNG
jgi:hypothetical protein